MFNRRMWGLTADKITDKFYKISNLLILKAIFNHIKNEMKID